MCAILQYSINFLFSGNQNRYYRNSLEIVKRAATEWRDMYKVEFIAQLGDIIDSKAKKNKGSDIELSKVIFFINIFI